MPPVHGGWIGALLSFSAFGLVVLQNRWRRRRRVPTGRETPETTAANRSSPAAGAGGPQVDGTSLGARRQRVVELPEVFVTRIQISRGVMTVADPSVVRAIFPGIKRPERF